MPVKKDLQIVWFKRDLRVCDHACLSRAAHHGDVLPLIIIEPDYWSLNDISTRHYLFLLYCIYSLRDDISSLGGTLIIRVGNVIDILDDLRKEHGTFTLWAHQETGNQWTYTRDNNVRTWCSSQQIHFHEPMQYGIWRGKDLDRNQWAKRWDMMMNEPIHQTPRDIRFRSSATREEIPSASALKLRDDGITTLQPGGRTQAEADLYSFLYQRGEHYRKDMSSPISGEWGCSRLSAHLAFGTLSMREIYQSTLRRITELKGLPKEQRGQWLPSLNSFVGRLHWHCHFSQKLETEPEIEYLPIARAYSGLRDDGRNPERLEAFAHGYTGYPFIDACMRYLKATGWINFRMRAMLMSFASYDLWLPWQDSGTVLARYFTDYEPGIHWPQCQMQSGVTGINTLRIYSPVKQGIDQDPDGVFTRQWVTELSHIHDASIHEPQTLWHANSSYVSPIIDHKRAVKEARDRVWAIRKTAEAKAEAEIVYLKHGSRKKTLRSAKR